MKKSRPYFRKTDIIIALLVVITSVAGFVFLYFRHADASAPATAEIRVNTKLTEEIDLTTVKSPYEVNIEGNLNVTLEVSRDGVKFISSQCPDKLCVHQGLIGSNRSAACLPAGVSVTVKGQAKADVDAVVG